MSAPTRPPLRYFGGKWRLSQWIIGHFPPHLCYVEAFAGGSSVLLRKPPAEYEVLNDLDGTVVTFFRVLRERTAELVRAIELTPYARAEQELAYEPTADELEIARRLYVRAWQTMGGPRTQWKSGWRFQHTDNRGKRVIDDWNSTDHLWAVAERLKVTQIERGDALTVIRRFDRADTLFYCDPPYVPDTRNDRWREKSYQHEMTDDDHRCLAETLHGIVGMAVVSGYRSPLYDQLFSDWTMVTRQEQTNNGGLAIECLWLSPNAVARARQLSMPLGEVLP